MVAPELGSSRRTGIGLGRSRCYSADTQGIFYKNRGDCRVFSAGIQQSVAGADSAHLHYGRVGLNQAQRVRVLHDSLHRGRKCNDPH